MCGYCALHTRTRTRFMLGTLGSSFAITNHHTRCACPKSAAQKREMSSPSTCGGCSDKQYTHTIHSVKTTQRNSQMHFRWHYKHKGCCKATDLVKAVHRLAEELNQLCPKPGWHVASETPSNPFVGSRQRKAWTVPSFRPQPQSQAESHAPTRQMIRAACGRTKCDAFHLHHGRR